MPISSEAAKAERSETRGLPHRVEADPKRPAPTKMWGEDIVRSSRKRLAALRVLGRNWTVSASGCWEWNLGKSHGYGQVRVSEIWGSTPVYAHRLAYVLRYGAIPEGLVVCHECDNPCCVNPDHLFLGTQADNVADMVSKGRHCPGEANGMVKITDTEVKAIKAMRQAGMTGRAIAKLFGVSEGHISTILKGKKRSTTGGELMPQHGASKHRDEDIIAAVDMRNNGVSIREICERFGWSDGQARQVLYSERTKKLLAKRGEG